MQPIHLFFLVRHYLELVRHHSKKQLPIDLHFQEFLDEIENALHQNPNELMNSLDNLIPQVFKIRLELLGYISESVDITKIAETMTEKVEELNICEKYYFNENILFACRTFQRVQNLMSPYIEMQSVKNDFRNDDVSQLDYYTEVSKMPSELAEWSTASLKAELIIIMAICISEKEIQISDEVIKILSEAVVETAQEFYALSKMLFEFPTPTEIFASESRESIEFPIADLEEEKQLADLDLYSSFEID